MATNADLNIAGPVGGTATILTLQTTNSFNIINQNNAVTNIISAKSVNFVTDSGAVGSVANPLLAKTGILTFTVGGDVTLTDTGTTTTLVGSTTTPSVVGGAVTLATNGATTINSLTLLLGDLFVQNATGALQTGINSKINALNGAITLQNNNVKSGTIVIGAGTQMATGQPFGIGGDITIEIKGAASAPNTTPPAKFVTVNATAPAQVLFGINNITAVAVKGVGNTLNADLANIVFDTGTLKATAIKLDGNVTITADPPLDGISVSPSVPASANLITTTPTAPTLTAPTSSAPTYMGAPINGLMAANPTISPQAQTVVFPAAAGALTALSNFSNAQALSQEFIPAGAAIAFASFGQGSLVGSSNLGTLNENNLLNLNQSSCSWQNSGQNLLQGSQKAQAWISETELESGSIPAAIIGDSKLGLRGTVEAGGQAPADNKIVINRGTRLCAFSANTLVQTPFGCIQMAPNAIALVMVMSDGMAVYNFDDRKTGDVKIISGTDVIALTPGRHALLTRNLAGAYEHVNPAQLFAYSNINKKEQKDIHIYTADFYLIQALKVVQPIRELLRASSHSAEAKRIANHLLKTAVLMSNFTGNGANYKLYLRQTAGVLDMRN